MTIKPIEVPDWIRSVLILDPTDIWGNVVGMGLGELSAVLSPAKRFDRRGNVLFVDSFEHGLASYLSGYAGTGGAVSISSERSQWGGLSVKLVGGSTSTRQAWFLKTLWQLPLQKVGVECFLHLDDYVDYILLTIDLYDGTNLYRGRIKADYTNCLLAYLNSGGTYTTFDDNWLYITGYEMWTPLKLVIDLESDEYVRVLSSRGETSLTGIALQPSSSALSPFTSFRVDCYSVSGANGKTFVDNLIITQNEPA